MTCIFILTTFLFLRVYTLYGHKYYWQAQSVDVAFVKLTLQRLFLKAENSDEKMTQRSHLVLFACSLFTNMQLSNTIVSTLMFAILIATLRDIELMAALILLEICNNITFFSLHHSVKHWESLYCPVKFRNHHYPISCLPYHQGSQLLTKVQTGFTICLHLSTQTNQASSNAKGFSDAARPRNAIFLWNLRESRAVVSTYASFKSVWIKILATLF